MQAVDVIAVDRAGHPVRDLKPSEFSARIGGRPRRVANAQFLGVPERRQDPLPSLDVGRSAVVGNSAVASDAAAAHWLVFFLDDESFGPGEALSVMRAAAEFLKRAPQAARYGISSVSSWGDLRVSSDPGEAAQRLASLHGSGTSPVRWLLADTSYPKLTSIGIIESMEAVERGNERVKTDVINRVCAELKGSDYEMCVMATEVRLQGISVLAGEMSSRQIRALTGMLASLARYPGTKHIIYVTRGIPMLPSNFSGSELTRLAAAAGAIVHVLYDEKFEVADASREFAVSPSQHDDTSAGLTIVESIAGATGGSFHHLVGTPDRILDSIGQEMGGVYRVGIEVEAGDLDRDSLDIRIQTSRRGVTVRGARRLIPTVRPGPKPTVEQRLKALLAGRDTEQSLSISLRTHVARDPTGGGLRLRVATRMETQGPVQAAYVLFTSTGERVSAGSARDQRAASGSVTTITASELVPPGDYVLRLAAVDDQSRAGAIEHRFRARLNSAAGAVFSDPLIWSASAGDAPLLSASDQIETSDAIRAFVEFYAAGKENVPPLDVHFDLCAQADGPALASDTQRVAPLPDRAVGARGLLRVGSLESGNYTFRVTVDDAQGKTQALWTRQIRLVRSQITADTVPTPPATVRVPALPKPPEARSRAPIPVLAAHARSIPNGFSMERALGKDVVERILTQLGTRTGGFRGALAAQAEAVRRGDITSGGTAVPVPSSRTGRLQWGILSGLTYLRAGNPAQASVVLLQAVSLAPDFTPAMFLLGLTQAASGRDGDAANAWLMGTASPDADPAIYAQGIDAMIRTGRIDDAAGLATEAQSRWRGDVSVVERAALVAALQGRTEAVEMLTRDRNGLSDAARVLRIAALHDLALNTRPHSTEWRAFATEAEQYLREGGDAQEAVRRWLEDSSRGGGRSRPGVRVA